MAADEAACLTCFGSGQGSAGRCAQFWDCEGREARVTCARPAEDAPAECECMLDHEVVDRVPYAPEFCRVEDMAAACRFVRPGH